jgi:hypothetical protein
MTRTTLAGTIVLAIITALYLAFAVLAPIGLVREYSGDVAATIGGVVVYAVVLGGIGYFLARVAWPRMIARWRAGR